MTLSKTAVITRRIPTAMTQEASLRRRCGVVARGRPRLRRADTARAAMPVAATIARNTASSAQ
ncbi:hypothetical protein [Frondihabitans sucicola]|uniref:hypothetical protein n=1 Tax=Frondihabitans sucicola TaxID=1268041 RepID=UPI00330666AD